MDKHSCQALIITCIDFRFQGFIENWAHKNFGLRNYDRVAIAGGVKDLAEVLKQLAISNRLHHIKKLVLVNHEDCGVYGAERTEQKHVQDLDDAASRAKKAHPDIKVESYYLKQDGTFICVAS